MCDMGRKKGDLNMATRKRMEEEKSKVAKKSKTFSFHKTIVIPEAKGDIAMGGTSLASVVKTAGVIEVVADHVSNSLSDGLINDGVGNNGIHTMENMENIAHEPGVHTQDGVGKIHCGLVARERNSDLTQHAERQAQANQVITRKGTTDLEADSHWIRELVQLKYNEGQIDSPNMAVQTMIVCIWNKEIHSYILFKEVNLIDKNKSLVTFLGFNGWFRLYQQLKFNFEFTKSKEWINSMYSDVDSIFFKRTVLEDSMAKVFMEGLTALESANDIISSFEEESTVVTGEKQEEAGECLFSDKDLTELDVFEFDMKEDAYLEIIQAA